MRRLLSVVKKLMRMVMEGLVCLLIAFDVICQSANAINLNVYYPEPGNYSVVNLICNNDFGRLADENITFLRNGELITAESVEYLQRENTTSILFTFNQAQEGEYSCRTSDEEISNVEPLAGT